MTTILRPDDMHKGQYVTVLNGADMAHRYTVDGDGDTLACERSVDHTLEGAPLVILSVNLPYIVVGLLSGPGRRIVDVREADLMRISIEYIESLLPSPPKPDEACGCGNCRAFRKLHEDLKNCAGK